jgi:hypothetical protein
VIAADADITSTPPSAAVVVSGDTYTQVTATDAQNLSLAYSLSGYPDGMTIDAASGLITWLTMTWTSDSSRSRPATPGAGTDSDWSPCYVCPKEATWSDGMGGSACRQARSTGAVALRVTALSRDNAGWGKVAGCGSPRFPASRPFAHGTKSIR